MGESSCVFDVPESAPAEPITAFSATRCEPSDVFAITKRDFSPLFALASFSLTRKLEDADEPWLLVAV